MSGPLLGLISEALKLWIRDSCDSVSSLELQLEGSALGVLDGRLEGASLTATDVRLSGMALGQVGIRAEAFALDLGGLAQGRPARLLGPLQIAISACLDGESLRWNLLQFEDGALGQTLLDQLLPAEPSWRLSDVVPWRQGITLVATGPLGQRQLHCTLAIAREGHGLLLQASDPAGGLAGPQLHQARLPLDPAISLTAVSSDSWAVQLQAVARLTSL